MKKTGHTPGPWEIATARNARYVSSRTEPKRGYIACVYAKGDHYDCESDTYDCPDEMDANARLIAAAPDLLEACQDADKAYKAVYPKLLRALQDEGEGVALYFAMRKIEAAIARATGQEGEADVDL